MITNYRLRSEGDNVLGSVRLSVLSRLSRLTYDLQESFSVQGICLCVD